MTSQPNDPLQRPGDWPTGARPISVFQAPATRRETFLFGLLILALAWTMWGGEPRTVIVVPETGTRAGIIT
jgi:hypothetical protein